ncbi:MAG: glutamine synthetase family protein [Elainella sp.]
MSIQAALEAHNTRFVRLLWCDNANVIRAKAFHVNFLEEHQTQGISISVAQQAIPVMYDAPAAGSGLGPVGEAWLVPDWSTLNALPYAPGHARVIADLIHQGRPWMLCPRYFLKRVLAQAQAEDLQIMAAFENEFYLLRCDEAGFSPADQTVFAATLGMDLNRVVIDQIAEALWQQNIPVERYYPESGPGQQEIAVRYSDALTAADRQIAFRETVRGVALQHNLCASFVPKIFANQAGSGCHLHFSLWRDGENLVPDGSGRHLSPVAQQFMAGILHHLPALMALTTPSPNSYRRLQPHFWSGAFRCWGFDNREAALRVPSNPSPPTPTHIELKTVDASANPYLALGAVILAGLDGIRHQRRLGEPVGLDPGHLSQSARDQQGIDRLPTQLGEAIAHLKRNKLLLDGLGPELAQAFLAVRQAEWEAMKNLSLEAEVELLLKRY